MRKFKLETYIDLGEIGSAFADVVYVASHTSERRGPEDDLAGFQYFDAIELDYRGQKLSIDPTWLTDDGRERIESDCADDWRDRREEERNARARD